MSRVLLVEDDVLIALSIEDHLIDDGNIVVTIGSLPLALEAAASQRFDAAVLDAKIGRDSSFPISQLLSSRGIPHFFCTGSTVEEIREIFGRGAVVVQKPFLGSDLTSALRAILQRP